jgi:hypothetical protein
LNAALRYAGLENVTRAGLSVVDSAIRLRRCAYIEERLMFLMAAHHVTVPERDIKVLLGRLQFEDACHADGLRTRVTEMRTPKGKLRDAPDDALAVLMEEAQHCNSTVEVLTAVAKVVKPSLIAAYEDYLQSCNGLADAPTVRLFNQILADEREHLRLLNLAFDEVVQSDAQKAESTAFLEHLNRFLSAARGVSGMAPRGPKLDPVRSTKPFKIPHELKRDKSLKRVWDFKAPPQEEVGRHLAYIFGLRLSEVNVSEGLGLVLCEVKDKPWEFYLDISRHLWDEVRHSLFGEVAIESTCQSRDAVPMRDYEGVFCMEADLMEQYAVLGLEVEGGNMKYPVGKRGEWEFCKDLAKHPLMTQFQDFDWADEVLHVNLARRRLEGWFIGTIDELSKFAATGKEHRTEIKKRQQAEVMPDLTPQLQKLHAST